MKIKNLGANKTELHVQDNVILFSYNTPVAAFVSGRGYVKTNKHYSKTTSKHINQWINGFEVETVDQEYINSLAI